MKLTSKKAGQDIQVKPRVWSMSIKSFDLLSKTPFVLMDEEEIPARKRTVQ